MHSTTPPRPRHRTMLLVVLVVLAMLVTGALAPATAQAQLNATGEWRLSSQTSPINPIHVALLRTGRVLIVAGSENDPTVTTYRATVWDPVSGTFSTQTIPWDLFCNAMSFLADGRVLTTGGNLQYNPFTGIRTTTIFDPVTEGFTQVQNMARGRWYPSNVALSDGSTMTFSGWLDTGGTNNAVEIYRLATGWSPEAYAPFTPPLYPWLHLLPDGRVFQSGAQVDSHIFNPSTQTWTTNVARTNYPDERNYGSSVLLPLKPSENYRARIMIMGGDNPATATAEMIDLSQPSPAWRTLPPMSAPRIQMSAVLLPNGKVLALGGSASNETESTASLNADLFDPATETWAPAGRMARARMYHSVALLLPDATVWVAGSNPYQGTWDNTMEIYRPPYLFTPAGALAARPAISGAPATVGYTTSFQVTTPDAASIASVALVRPGSATHAFDFEQRVINLSFTAGSGTLTLTAPPSANLAPPGYYMLFLIDGNGVPSVATWVQVTATPGNQPPQGTITSPGGDVTIGAGTAVSFAGSGSDPDGTVATYAWVFPGGTPSSSSSATPGNVVFSTAGVYDVSLVVTDNSGASDPSPPARRVTVQPAGLTASFTNPAAGATVAGTQPVAMSVRNATGNSNVFTLTIDGTQVYTTTTASTNATYNWDTRPYGNGAHTLGLSVRDASGATATATLNVIVNNNVSSGEITVTFPNLTPGQTIRGLQTVQIQAANTSGTSNRFEIAVDGVVQDLVFTTGTSITWAWNTMGLPNGSHTVSAMVHDATGRGGTGSQYVTVQNTLSVAITSPTTSATVSGITWVTIWVDGASSASSSFTLTVAGVVVASQTSSDRPVTVPWDTSKTPNGAQTLVAQVRDASGNGGQFTRPVTVQNTIDPPAASFTSPAAGATVSGTAAVGLKATGGTAPYTYRLTIDSTEVFATTVSATTATHSWPTASYPNGGHLLRLTVTDTRGNATTATRIVNTQNGPGSLAASFTAPAAGATVSGTAVSIGMAASGGTPNYTYRLTVDDTLVFTSLATASTAATYSWSSTTVANGTHTLGLTVTDATGASATATRTVTVSNSGAVTAGFSSPAAGATVSGTVSVGMTAGGGTPAYTYTLTIDGTQVFTTSTSATAATYAWNTTTAANGGHTLGLTVRDSTGASATATRAVTVGNSGGTLQVYLTQPAPGSTVSGLNWAVIWLSGASGTSNVYTLTVGTRTVGTQTTSSTGPVSIPWDTTAVANGAQVLTASVRDATGNTGTTGNAITVANGPIPLAASFTSPAAGATVGGAAVAIGMAAGGGSAPYTYRLTIDGTQRFTTTTSATSASFSWNTTAVTNGTHTLGLTVTDSTGAVATTSRTVTVNNTAGGTFGVFITAPSSGQTVQGTQWVTIWNDSSATGARTYTMTVGGSTVWTESASGNPVSLPWVTTNGPNGPQTLVVTVRDSANATGTSSVTVTVQNP